MSNIVPPKPQLFTRKQSLVARVLLGGLAILGVMGELFVVPQIEDENWKWIAAIAVALFTIVFLVGAVSRTQVYLSPESPLNGPGKIH